MQYTISISGSNVSASQLNMVLTIDKTLDYGSFAVRNQLAEPYAVGDMVDIDITDGVDTNSYHFIVSADDVTQLPNGYYLHTIDIIELTKILEWQTESIRTFTQKVDYIDPDTGNLVTPTKLTLLDVVVRLQFTTPLEQVSNLGNTRVFAIDNSIRARLAAVESPDFQFNNKNLKEILIEIFDFVDAIPRLTKISDSITLTADFYNDKGLLVTEDSFYRMKRLNINDYSTSIDSNIKNLYDSYTEIADPSPTGYKKLTSDEGFLTEENAYLKTQYPIVELVSLKVKYGSREYDIKDWVFEKEEWDLLLRPPLGGDVEGKYRDNTLFFERFKPNIDGLFDNLSNVPLVQRIRIENLLRSVEKQEEGIVSAVFPDFQEYQFQITYKAQIDSRTEVKRLNTDVIKYDSQTIVGQTDNVVRADRVLDRLFKLQQLLGNAERMTSERTKTLADLYNLADYTADDYVLTTIEMDCSKEYIMAKYMWSQRYQKVSNFIGLNNEIRLYPIPLDSYKRNIYIEDFVEVGLTEKTNTSLIDTLGLATFMNGFSNSPQEVRNRPVKVFTYNSESIVEFEGYDNTDNTLVKPITAYTGGNSLNFHVEFDTATTIGAQLDQENTTFQPPINRPIIYTNNEGEVFDFEFNFANNYTISNIDNLPIINKADVSYKQVIAPSHRIFKDTREIFALTYALHVIPEGDLDDQIIIGKYLVERNNLLKSLPMTSSQFEVVGSNTPYTLADNRFSRLSDTVVAQTYSINGNRLMLSGTVAFTSWAIRKIDTKELVVAVNQGATPITSLWFNFRDKQTGVTYPSQTSQPTSIVKRPTQIALNPASPITDSTISVLWVDGNTDPVADEFELSISDDLVNWTTEVTQAPAITNSYQFTGLEPYTRYTIRIRARIGTNFSEWAYFEATTTVPSPNAPTNLVLTLIGDRRILVEWEAENDVFLHRIELSEESDFSTILKIKQTFGLDTNTEFDFIDDGIDYSTQYYIRVRVLRDGQFSAYTSDDITTADSPITAPPTITNVSVSGSTVSYTLINTDTQLVTLFSDLSSGATQRATNVRPNEAVQVSQSFGASDNSIFAKAQASLKSASQVVSIPFAADEAPDAPGIAVGGITSAVGVTTVNWVVNTGSPQVDGFIIERNPNRNNQAVWGIISDTVPPTARSYEDRTRINGETTYTYRVVAYNRIGSAVSNQRSITTIAMRPAAPSSLAVSQTQIISTSSASTVLTWQRNSTDEIGFIIEWRETSTMANFIEIDGAAAAAATHYVIFDRVGSGTKSYLFRVRAFNEYGVSNPSNEALILI